MCTWLEADMSGFSAVQGTDLCAGGQYGSTVKKLPGPLQGTARKFYKDSPTGNQEGRFCSQKDMATYFGSNTYYWGFP